VQLGLWVWAGSKCCLWCKFVAVEDGNCWVLLLLSPWLFVGWQYVFVEQHTFLPMIMLLDEYGMYCCMMVVSGIRWRCFISVVEGVVVFNVLYTTVMGWHAVMTTLCICGWTTVVLSVLIHHGGVVWSWYEWSWLLQYCCQTISWSLLLVWVGMEYCLMCAAMVVVCGDVAVVWNNVYCCLLLPHDVGWCCWWWYCFDVPPWWWHVVAATSRWLRLVFLYRAIPSWWCMMMLLCRGWLLWLLIWCFCQTNSYLLLSSSG